MPDHILFLVDRTVRLQCDVFHEWCHCIYSNIQNDYYVTVEPGAEVLFF